jgi:hypothetical protein
MMLFNLEDDPQERRNLAAEYPQIVAELAPAAQRWIDQGVWIPNAHPGEAERDRLAALGYLDPGEEAAGSRAEPFPDEAARFGLDGFWTAAVSGRVAVSPKQHQRIDAIVQDTIERMREAEGYPIKQRRIRREMRARVRRVLDEEQRATLSLELRRRPRDTRGEAGRPKL